jgi:hypothetical protein
VPQTHPVQPTWLSCPDSSVSLTLHPIGISLPDNQLPNLITPPEQHPHPLIVNGRCPHPLIVNEQCPHPLIIDGCLDLHALTTSHLSPDSTFNILHDCKWTTEGTLAIVKGIVNVIHAHQAEHDLKVRKLESDICHLHDTVARYKETFNMSPEGFELATNLVAQIQIPIGMGFH